MQKEINASIENTSKDVKLSVNIPVFCSNEPFLLGCLTIIESMPVKNHLPNTKIVNM